MSKSVLVVDDYADILYLFKLSLESEGYEVKQASNGKEALAMVKEINPELVVLDVMMPDTDGLEVTRQIRSQPSLSTMPILLVSANYEISQDCAYNNGANDILYKPFRLEKLFDKVKGLIKSENIVSFKQ
ncbi:response regulator receiver protein [Stanieria cyanosphaera PCC 7437]|uniref:Response regulator receiver protein n=1 Tax=Stanieria cyanosphaera (strain ATCC 29371 / PCC 7437) TaxID=111780 RepID=K9XVL3_STAC7|nr:response regulator [Stanieria cyanosphaera]AFZ36109.1 response regulator receiver protein [Stanieria cyanosphaera PCC 7437]